MPHFLSSFLVGMFFPSTKNLRGACFLTIVVNVHLSCFCRLVVFATHTNEIYLPFVLNRSGSLAVEKLKTFEKNKLLIVVVAFET